MVISECDIRFRGKSQSEIMHSTFRRPFVYIKGVSLKSRIKIFLSLVILTGTVYYLVFHVFDNHLKRDSFLETDKCPACYGSSLCFALFNGDIKMAGASKVRFLDNFNSKNVHMATLGDRKIIFKKLANDRELDKIDLDICLDANRKAGCDIARVVHTASFYRRVSDEVRLTLNVTTNLNDMLSCPTTRLLKRIEKMYKERTSDDRLMYKDKIALLTTLRVNPHPIMVQTFPSNDGWPFPTYLGACGRFVAESYEGDTLENFYDAPFYKRVDIAFQLLKIAELFSENKDQFGLYWTDVSYSNIAVDQTGKVTVIDAENIIVVDKLHLKKEKKEGWDEYHQSKYKRCKGKNCYEFDISSLCKHADSDHNFYIICASLLSPQANNPRYSGGFLHDMPDIARDDWELEHLLNQCTHPQVYKGRHHVKERLIRALDKLRIILLSDDPEKYSNYFRQL